MATLRSVVGLVSRVIFIILLIVIVWDAVSFFWGRGSLPLAVVALLFFPVTFFVWPIVTGDGGSWSQPLLRTPHRRSSAACLPSTRTNNSSASGSTVRTPRKMTRDMDKPVAADRDLILAQRGLFKRPFV